MRNLLLPAADINECDNLWMEEVWSGTDGNDKNSEFGLEPFILWEFHTASVCCSS